ncbi:MAG: DME family drug/metabolite transporter [Parasphingorhabdus sp.]|jgi:DME family drug/metabolite transporter
MSKPLSHADGMILVLLAGVFWSTMGIGIRSIVDANVWQILLYRSIALTLFLLLIISVRSKWKPWRTIKRSGAAGVIGGWGLVFAFSGGIYAIQTTTVANAMFLFASAPFLAAFLGWVILRESVRKSTWYAMIIAIFGIIMMVVDGFSTGNSTGNISAMLSATGFAVFTIALRWGKLEDMMPTVLLAGYFATIVALTVCLVNDYSLHLSSNDAIISVAMGVFQVGVGLAIFTLGSKVVPAAELALLCMTEVLLGPIWVWIFLGETASTYTLIGGAILMVAIGLNALTGLRRKPIPVL